MSEVATLEEGVIGSEVVQETPVPDSTPNAEATPGDAANQPADAAPDTEGASLDSEIEAALNEVRGSKESEPAPAREPERRGVDPEVVRAQVEKFRNSHGTRQQKLNEARDSLAEKVSQGHISAEEAIRQFSKLSSDTLNEHHADSLKDAGYEAWATGIQQNSAEVEQAVYGALSKAQQTELTELAKAYAKENGSMMPWSEAMKASHELASKSGHTKGFDEGFKEGYRKARAQTASKSSSTESSETPNGVGTAGNSGPLTVQDALNLPTEELIRRGYGKG